MRGMLRAAAFSAGGRDVARINAGGELGQDNSAGYSAA